MDEFYYLSWTIAPEWRHRGLGKKMIKTVEINRDKYIKAVIKKYNIASIKLAMELELSLQKEENDLLIFYKKAI